MFEKCLNKKCDVTVAFGTYGSGGAAPATYFGTIVNVNDDYIEFNIEDAVRGMSLRKVKGQNYTIFIKKEYIISIMIVE